MGKLRYVNDAALGIRGRSREEVVEGIGIDQYVDSWQITHFDGTPYKRNEVPLARAILYGESCDEQFIVRRPDRQDRVVWATAAPVVDDQGEITAGIVVFPDITELKQTEVALAESERRFRSTFEQAAVGIAHVAADGRWLRVNQRLSDIVGYSREELLGSNFQHITHPDDLSADLSYVDQVLADEIKTYSMEKRYIRKDGRTVWINLTVSLVRDNNGEPDYFISVVEDISSRKQMEDEVRLVAAFPMQNPNPVLRVSSEGIVLYASSSSAALLRVWKSATGKSVPKRWQERIRAVIEKGTVAHAEQVCGDKVYLLAIAPIPAASFVNLYGIDIAKQRKAIADLHQLTEELEDRVQRRTRELEAMTHRLQVANRELEAFAYSVSHDLRAPLRGIDGFSQALLEDYGDSLDDTGRHYLERARSAAQRMGRLIDDILVLSRASRVEMIWCEVDLSDLAWQIAGELAAGEPHRDVTFTIAPGLKASGDRTLIKQALTNLLGNAWKFSSCRSDTKIEFGECSQQEVNSSGSAGYRQFFVRDNGTGFDMRYAHKLFGAFQRLHGQQEFPGTGIGLATAQRIIHRHGGEIWADGQVGVGATFHFTLPTLKRKT